MAVTGAVDLLDPGAESVERFVAFSPFELPPPRHGPWLIGIAAFFVIARSC